MTAAAEVVAGQRPPPPPRALGVTAALVVLLVLGLGWVEHPIRVEGASMEPTYHRGDHLLLRTWGVRGELPSRGTVVVVRSPDGESLVKRVAAVAGDEVGIADGLLVVNGSVVDEPWLDQPSVDGTWFGPERVPDDEVFVLGDHRADSVDSRRLGPLAMSSIEGVVVARLWPPDPNFFPRPRP